MIEVQGVRKRYGSTVAVDGLSFTVRPGQVTGFVGANGAGKSTTMRLMLGLDRPTAGRVLIHGRPYHRLDRPLRQVGALLEAGAAHGGRRGADHLRWLARSNGIPRSRVDEVLEQVGLADVARRRVRSYSLGMAQRLGIAAALVGDPPVLLLDEPGNGLDPEGIVWVRALVKRLAGEGRTVLVSSHQMAEMALTADHLVVIDRGRLLADSSVTAFIEAHAHSYVVLRTSRPERARAALTSAGLQVTEAPDGALTVHAGDTVAVGELLSSHGLVVHEMSRRAASLEEAFMRLTGSEGR